MIKQIVNYCASLKATIIGAVFLAASLVLMLCGVHLAIDPVWVTVVICGLPIF